MPPEPDLTDAARTTSARLRWERMSRPPQEVAPEAPPGPAEPSVEPDAVQLAERHVD